MRVPDKIMNCTSEPLDIPTDLYKQKLGLFDMTLAFSILQRKVLQRFHFLYTRPDRLVCFFKFQFLIN